MSPNPVVSIKQKTDKQHGTRWQVIIRGAIYHEARLVTYTTFLEHALAVAEEHLRLWGYNEIEITRAIANAYRNLRRRYGGWVLEEPRTRVQEEAAKQAEPYPD